MLLFPWLPARQQNPPRLLCSSPRIFHGTEIQDEVNTFFFFLRQMGYAFFKNKNGYYSFYFQVISEARLEGSVLGSLKFWHLNGFSGMVPMTTKLSAGIEYHLCCEIVMPQKCLSSLMLL